MDIFFSLIFCFACLPKKRDKAKNLISLSLLLEPYFPILGPEILPLNIQ